MSSVSIVNFEHVNVGWGRDSGYVVDLKLNFHSIEQVMSKETSYYLILEQRKYKAMREEKSKN